MNHIIYMDYTLYKRLNVEFIIVMNSKINYHRPKLTERLPYSPVSMECSRGLSWIEEEISDRKNSGSQISSKLYMPKHPKCLTTYYVQPCIPFHVQWVKV